MASHRLWPKALCLQVSQLAEHLHHIATSFLFFSLLDCLRKMFFFNNFDWSQRMLRLPLRCLNMRRRALDLATTRKQHRVPFVVQFGCGLLIEFTSQPCCNLCVGNSPGKNGIIWRPKKDKSVFVFALIFVEFLSPKIERAWEWGAEWMNNWEKNETREGSETAAAATFFVSALNNENKERKEKRRARETEGVKRKIKCGRTGRANRKWYRDLKKESRREDTTRGETKGDAWWGTERDRRMFFGEEREVGWERESRTEETEVIGKRRDKKRKVDDELMRGT